MFEKEAKEYGKENCAIQKNGLCTFVDSERTSKIWQDGAEFGYNKANEWHYVKDGNPNNENDILCQISKDEVVVGYYHIKEKRYITIDGQVLYNVIAWKEIVLPELKESEIKSEMFPEIILPEGSAEFVDKIIADTEKRLKGID